MPKFKRVERTTTVEAAFEDAKADIESLRDEMTEWAENMESNGMEQLPKYDEVNEAKESLESAVSSLEDVDISTLPDALRETEVKYTEVRPYGRKPEPRWMRLSNCVSMLHAAKDAISAAEDESLQEKVDAEEADENEEETEEVDFGAIGNGIDEAIDYAEAVSFPGMY